MKYGDVWRKAYYKHEKRRRDWGMRSERGEWKNWVNVVKYVGRRLGLTLKSIVMSNSEKEESLGCIWSKEDEKNQDLDPHITRMLAIRTYAFASISAILLKACWASAFVSSYNVFCCSTHRNRVCHSSHRARLRPGLSSDHRSEVFSRVETDSLSTALWIWCPAIRIHCTAAGISACVFLGMRC